MTNIELALAALVAEREMLAEMMPSGWTEGNWQMGYNPWAPTICPPTHGGCICRFDRYGIPEQDIADCSGIIHLRNTAVAKNALLEALLRPFSRLNPGTSAGHCTQDLVIQASEQSAIETALAAYLAATR